MFWELSDAYSASESPGDLSGVPPSFTLFSLIMKHSSSHWPISEVSDFRKG